MIETGRGKPRGCGQGADIASRERQRNSFDEAAQIGGAAARIIADQPPRDLGRETARARRAAPDRDPGDGQPVAQAAGGLVQRGHVAGAGAVEHQQPGATGQLRRRAAVLDLPPFDPVPPLLGPAGQPLELGRQREARRDDPDDRRMSRHRRLLRGGHAGQERQDQGKKQPHRQKLAPRPMKNTRPGSAKL